MGATMGAMDFASLGGAVAVVSLALLVEHFLTEHWPKQWNYAVGLVTAMGGMMLWAILWGMVAWDVALALLAGACLSGVPNFVFLVREAQERREQWADLMRTNRKLASRLALVKQMDGHGFRRTRDLAETLSFALGTAQREMEMLRVWQEQAEPLLRPILDAVSEEDGDDVSA